MESLEDRFLTPNLRSARKDKNAEEIDTGDEMKVKNRFFQCRNKRCGFHLLTDKPENSKADCPYCGKPMYKLTPRKNKYERYFKP